MFSDKNPVMSDVVVFFYHLIPTANQQKRITIQNAEHFLQEDKDEEISGYIDQFMKGELLSNTD